MSVTTKTGASGDVYRLHHYGTIENTGTNTVQQTSAKEDRMIHGALSIGDHIRGNMTAEVEVISYFEPQPLDEIQVNFTPGGTGESDRTNMLFDHGYNHVNDAVNGVGLGSGIQTENITFPVAQPWDENQTLSTLWWVGTNTGNNLDLRVIYYYTEP